MTTPINIVFITDNNYIMQTCTAILSLVLNKNADTFYNINVMGNGLTSKNNKVLSDFNTKNVEISIISSDNASVSGENICKSSVYSSNVLLKLKLDTIFYNIDKILFLDSDTIITKDLSELYNTDLNDYYIGAVKDTGAPIYHLTHNDKYSVNPKYFNTGVMLLNLKKIRNDSFFNKVTENYSLHPEKYFFPEQDVLNELINDGIKLLPSKYNYITSSGRYTKTELKNFFGNEYSSEIPVILHFAGGCRPWIYKNIFFAKEWYKYYNKTVFSDIKTGAKFVPLINCGIFLLTRYKIIKNIEIYKKAGFINRGY